MLLAVCAALGSWGASAAAAAVSNGMIGFTYQENRFTFQAARGRARGHGRAAAPRIGFPKPDSRR